MRACVEIDFVTLLESLSERLSNYKSRVDLTISPNDKMFRGELDSYLMVGHSVITSIAGAMIAAGKSSAGSVLDLPCGHGRATRALRAAFPEAEITVCDVDRDAVDFCAARFDAVPVYSKSTPEDIPLAGNYDVIWCGSLITHLDRDGAHAFLNYLVDRLAPAGVLVFSTHGRNAVFRWTTLADARWAAIVADYDSLGYGYRDHPGGRGYGTSAAKPSWMVDQFFDRDDVMVVSYVERGLGDFQDTMAVMRQDVHHGQNAWLVV